MSREVFLGLISSELAQIEQTLKVRTGFKRRFSPNKFYCRLYHCALKYTVSQ